MNWGVGAGAPWPWRVVGSGSGTSPQSHGVTPQLAQEGRHKGRPHRGAPGGAPHGSVLPKPARSDIGSGL